MFGNKQEIAVCQQKKVTEWKNSAQVEYLFLEHSSVNNLAGFSVL